MKDIINNLLKSDTWKTQLIVAIRFVFSKDIREERVMHSDSDNIEIMRHDKVDQVTGKVFESVLSRYQIGSDFIFDCVNLLYYKCYKRNFYRG